MTLRPYQLRIVEAVEAGWAEATKQLAVCPTGGGKTICFAHLAQRNQPGRTLILAHREELVDQAIDKLARATGIFAGKEKAEFSAHLTDPVVVASIQSMQRRLGNWPADHFKLVVVDEAHHAMADSWQTVLRHFDGHARVLGVTATPDRGDRRNLGSYFERVAAEVSLVELVHDGFLSRIAVESVPLPIDLSEVRSKAGDFSDSDLGAALDPHLDKIADMLADKAAFRRTLAFLPLRATSRRLVDALIERGVAAAHVDGDSPDRREILDRFARSEFDVLCNAMLLTEGFDDPGIDCVCVLRPTRSRSLYCQMIGRGTRPAEAKSNLLVLDPLWMHERHTLIRPANLVSKDQKQAEELTAKLTEEQMDLLDVQAAVSLEREETLRKELEKASKKKRKSIDAIEFCLSAGGVALADYEATLPWEQKPVTDGQRAMLERAGIDLETIKNRGHATQVCDVLVQRARLNLATPKQVRCLQRLGVRGAVFMSFGDAGRVLGERFKKREKTPTQMLVTT